jgi:hypothetical protein
MYNICIYTYVKLDNSKNICNYIFSNNPGSTIVTDAIASPSDTSTIKLNYNIKITIKINKLEVCTYIQPVDIHIVWLGNMDNQMAQV